METRTCYSCRGDGQTHWDDDCQPETCETCYGTGEVGDVCHCAALCTCECCCGYDDGSECICWEG